MKRLLFVIILTFMFCGCNDSTPTTDPSNDTPNENTGNGNESGLWSSPHYITDYHVPSKIEVAVNTTTNALYLYADGDVYHTDPLSVDELSEEARFFTELYGDTSYGGAVHPGMHSALAYPLNEITIHCDKDFDTKHPSGEPLDDIVALVFGSYYPFIENGYKRLPAASQSSNGDIVDYSLCFNAIDSEVTKLINIELTNPNTKGDFARIQFKSAPDTPGEYTFSLSATFNDKTMTTSFKYTFK